MTDRIKAALEALDLANLNINDYDIHDPKLDDIIFAQRTVQDAAPDMAAEIVKLRKWQSEALLWLKGLYEGLTSDEFSQIKNGPSLDRLIAEAKEGKESEDR